MKFWEFKQWCNDRVFDGCWGMYEALCCMAIREEVCAKPFWKRERKWQELNAEYAIENAIVIPTNRKNAGLQKENESDHLENALLDELLKRFDIKVEVFIPEEHRILPDKEEAHHD